MYAFAEAVAGTVTVIVAESELPDDKVTQSGLNVTFQPAGIEALKHTGPLNPPRETTVMVWLAIDPLFADGGRRG